MLQRLSSRKFLVTVSALLTALLGADVDLARLAIIGAVAGIYVLVEGLIDKTRAEQFAEAVGEGLKIGRKFSLKEKDADAS